MAQVHWDVIIVGQGIAGTTLAWHLTDADQRVLLIDAQEQVTSSKIAAGLITPITGKRLALSWQVDKFLPVARQFYKRIEVRTGHSFFHERRAVRLFQSAAERQVWEDRRGQPDLQAYLAVPQPAQLLDPVLGDASNGGFAMHTAQLNVNKYLSVSRAMLPTDSFELNWQQDVTFGSQEISVRGYRARYLISCEGYAAARNPFFSWVPFHAARGDILTVRFHRPVPPYCLHRGIWIAPTSGAQTFRVGSTYEWEDLDRGPSASARQEIEHRLREFFYVRYTVLEHHAAVRPIIRESRPHISLHPLHKQLGIFNGLGSKGALHAPWYAKRFTDFLVNKAPLPEEADMRQDI